TSRARLGLFSGLFIAGSSQYGTRLLEREAAKRKPVFVREGIRKSVPGTRKDLPASSPRGSRDVSFCHMSCPAAAPHVFLVQGKPGKGEDVPKRNVSRSRRSLAQ